MQSQKPKPGPGWKHLAGSVWEHTSGVRISTPYAVRTTNSEMFFTLKWDKHIRQYLKYLRITGGNEKRALMLWAEHLQNAIHSDQARSESKT